MLVHRATILLHTPAQSRQPDVCKSASLPPPPLSFSTKACCFIFFPMQMLSSRASCLQPHFFHFRVRLSPSYSAQGGNFRKIPGAFLSGCSVTQIWHLGSFFPSKQGQMIQVLGGGRIPIFARLTLPGEQWCKQENTLLQRTEFKKIQKLRWRKERSKAILAEAQSILQYIGG